MLANCIGCPALLLLLTVLTVSGEHYGDDRVSTVIKLGLFTAPFYDLMFGFLLRRHWYCSFYWADKYLGILNSRILKEQCFASNTITFFCF